MLEHGARAGSSFAAGGRPSRREAGTAVLLAALASAVLLGPHVADGGRYLDDWWLGAYMRFPEALGFSSGGSYLSFYSGARPGAVAHWLAAYEAFGFHDTWHRALNAGWAAVLSATLYLLLRELEMRRWDATAITALTLALPVADSMRFWMTPGLGQLCVATCVAGYTLSLRGLRAHGWQARRLHGGALALFAVSVLMAETMLPAIGLSLLVYRIRVGWSAALKRWALDGVLVVLAAGHYAVNAPKRNEGPASLDAYVDHAGVLADQALTLAATSIVPIVVDRGWIVLGLVILVAAVLRWGSRRWLGIAGLAAIFVGASYVIYVPADPSYQPLAPGVGNRVNIGALVPLSVLVYALVRAVAGLISRPRGVFVVAVACWAAVMAGALVRQHDDRRLWEAAASQQQAVLGALHAALPNPPPGSSMLVLNAPGVVTRPTRIGDRWVNTPVPVFSTWWELDGAVKLSYDRSDLHAYPIWAYQPAQIVCGANRVYQLGLDGVRHALTYGRAYVVDVRAQVATRLDSQRLCDAVVARSTTVRFDLPV